MAIDPPPLQPLRYEDLVREAVARIPVSTPEWTTRSPGDPGLTLLELFAFLMESVSFGVNSVPDRNRATFLRMLGVPRAAGAAARGVVAFTSPAAHALDGELALVAGEVPFTTDTSLDVLPVEARAVVKRRAPSPAGDVLRAYEQLYAALGVAPGAGGDPGLSFYDTVIVDPAAGGVTLADAVDGAVWVALLLPRDARGTSPEHWEDLRAECRRTLAGRTLSLGVVPLVTEEARTMIGAPPPGRAVVEVAVPAPPQGGTLSLDPAARIPAYRVLAVRHGVDVTREPGVVEVTLPGNPEELGLWTDVEPVEEGTGAFPPALAEPGLADRVVTWLRVRNAAGALSGVAWVGVNAMTVTQRDRVVGERLPSGTGDADQQAVLSRTPVAPGSVTVTVTGADGSTVWGEVDDLIAAGPELGASDDRRPPGATGPVPRPSRVFALDPASGTIRFGSGLRGARPADGASVLADYDVVAGAAGNVAAGALNRGVGLPLGVTVVNPVRTWGGADPQPVREWERQAAQFLRHRERLVTVDDIVAVTRRTPAVDVVRVEVRSAWRPGSPGSQEGDAPGVVTVMVVPRVGEGGPEWPTPGAGVLQAVCAHLEPRRLVTTELVVRGPEYVGVWVSVGVEVEAGEPQAAVCGAARAAVRRFLAAVDPEAPPWFEESAPGIAGPFVHTAGGWPLRSAVLELELVAVVSRVAGVRLVRRVLLADAAGVVRDEIGMTGLQLPRVLGVSVTDGDPVPIDALRGTAPPEAAPAALPVPRVPEVC